MQPLLLLAKLWKVGGLLGNGEFHLLLLVIGTEYYLRGVYSLLIAAQRPSKYFRWFPAAAAAYAGVGVGADVAAAAAKSFCLTSNNNYVGKVKETSPETGFCDLL